MLYPVLEIFQLQLQVVWSDFILDRTDILCLPIESELKYLGTQLILFHHEYQIILSLWDYTFLWWNVGGDNK